MNYESISAGYESQSAALWDSLNAPQCECCSWCKNYIPSALACYTEINENKVFCSTYCRAEWVEENAWEYEK
jgi:hypothetical protein